LNLQHINGAVLVLVLLLHAVHQFAVERSCTRRRVKAMGIVMKIYAHFSPLSLSSN
jgi:hypothetical protein